MSHRPAVDIIMSVIYRAEGNENRVQHTIIATTYVPAVYDGLPKEEILICDGSEALDSLIVFLFGVPSVELLDESLCRASRRLAAGRHWIDKLRMAMRWSLDARVFCGGLVAVAGTN